MNEVFIIMAFPHTGYGAPYVWEVFNSLEKAEIEIKKISKKYHMEYRYYKNIKNKTALLYKEPPSIAYRFESFNVYPFFVE